MGAFATGITTVTAIAALLSLTAGSALSTSAAAAGLREDDK